MARNNPQTRLQEKKMQKAFETIEKYHMVRPGDRVLAGVSGGADSVCLLMVLLELQKRVKFAIQVVHVEHGIRGTESFQDAEYVRKLCGQYQVPFLCVSRDIPKMAKERKLSVEEAGRLARYEIFEETGRAWKADRIAVAHNRNDQAETILWNLARGSGLDGAAGIRPVRGRIIRPLLECSREEIEHYLRKKKVTWREDGTNQELDYTRNIIRNRILPEMAKTLNEKTADHLASFGTEMRRTEEFLQKLVRAACEKMADIQSGKVCIKIAPFLQEDVFLQERIIRTCLKEAGCSLKDMRREHVERMVKLAGMQSGRRVRLPGEWEARRSFEYLKVEKTGKQEMKKPEEICLKIPGKTETSYGIFETRIFLNENQPIPEKKYTKWLNYDKINEDIWLRSRKAGDYLTVNRQGGRKKLKSYFTEEKIPVEEREQTALAVCGSEVLWVVGHRISEAYKVGKNTREILEITYKEAALWQNISAC